MLPNIVHHLLNAYSLKLLGVCSALMEQLCVQVVVVVLDVLVCLSEQKHDVYTLFDLLRWEVRLHHINIELVLN